MMSVCCDLLEVLLWVRLQIIFIYDFFGFFFFYVCKCKIAILRVINHQDPFELVHLHYYDVDDLD
jgi:hypothetical protein